MSLIRVKIENFKSIKKCDIMLSELNVLIGENGTGKTNILEAIQYFYDNLTASKVSDLVFDQNNRYSNEIRITLYFDFSEFVKISKSNFGENLPSDKNKYGRYYKSIMAIASKAMNHIIPITMSQIKGRTITWNYSYEDRFIFKSLFPFFYIDTRNLDIEQWQHIWNILGEIGKVSNDERKILEDSVQRILLDGSMEISKKIIGIEKIFSAANVSIKPATSKEFARNLSKIFFSGDTIQQNGKNLRYYSTGTNSVKYIELLLKTIDEIAKTKLKEPVILLDEPEISLHPLYIDELAENLTNISTKLRILISTHSARLTKNIINSSNNVKLYNVKLIDQYTVIQSMKIFSQYSPESKYRVDDDHINSYFSKAIIFVEGETELELFSNPYIQMLFPKLKYVDVFKAMSQEPILNIMNPRMSQSKVPYFCLVDMDKIWEYSSKTNQFKMKNQFFKDTEKEKFQYRNKRESKPYLYHQHERIDEMAKKLRIHYYRPFYSCEDINFTTFINVIHEYLLYYNVFTLQTTVEGMLINKQTINLALNFLKQHKRGREFNSFNTYIEELKKCDKINVLRMVYNGKSDLLQKYSNICQTLPKTERDIIDQAMFGKKASGWISEYIDGYFQNATGITEDFSVKSFKRYLKNDAKRNVLIKDFKHNFFELYSLITKICDTIY